GERLQGCRVRDREAVRREDLAVDVLGARRGADISARTLLELGDEAGAAAEAQHDVDVGVGALTVLGQLLERVRESSGGEHRDLLGVGGAPGEQHENGERCPPHGRSITTFVDLTLAVASTPGSSRSSSAASRLMSDTTRNGPACSSTCAITPSLTTRV